MLPTVFEGVCILFVVWPLLRIFKRLLTRTTLDNVPGPAPESWLTGNLTKLYDFNAFKTHREIEETYGSIMKFYGVLGETQLYVSDPRALHHIFVKDQDVFVEPEEYYAVNGIHFGEGILNSKGDKHRRHRKLLGPAFNITQMRQLAPVFYEVTNKLKGSFEGKLLHGPEEIDILSWMTRIALELMGQAGLGYSFDTLADGDAPGAFARAVKELFPTEDQMILARQYILPWAMKIGPPGFRRYIVNHVPWKALHDVRDIIDTIEGYMMRIYRQKKEAFELGDDAVIGGKDILTTLLKANAVDKDRMTEAEVIGNVRALVFAALDTTSSALSATLHMLAKNPDAQQRLREEVLKASNDDESIPYDTLVDLPFLDAVCRETLRLFPPLVTVPRVTATNAILPIATPITGVDGRQLNEILIPANTPIYSSVLSSNRNPAIWGPDTYEWKPERWINGLPSTVKEASIPGIYSHLMTFLGGGHSCIGFKFSQLEMKIVLAVLVKNFEFSPSIKDKDIFWETTSISSPALMVNGEKTHQLPLVVKSFKS
ncbi:hypothetical protein Hypma_001992 [Hypsizygus marmoreus]|uniref:Cytochrome P450 n=1 Tax=Hypsizygus marmoreus TaxID=39966 RepID=A0A369J5L8_HYPMA|nr:hypothetical protein Hypma_001992 [Hypsizygus marmoreus]